MRGLDAGSDEFLTPAWLRDTLPDIDLDPCTQGHNPIGASRFWTCRDDGLARSRVWSGVVWCNPPYSDKARWMAKAVAGCRGGGVDCVLSVLPAQVGDGHWWKFVWTEARLVGFVEGRVKFERGPKNVPTRHKSSFSCSVVAWSGSSKGDAVIDSWAERLSLLTSPRVVVVRYDRVGN